jgi:hypothetical protein
LVENLPPGFHIVADAAYMVSEHLLGPYHGAQRDDDANAIFNFYLSQLRIRIEMAFGLLTTKWRILRVPLTVNVVDGTLAKIVETCAILHNFVITHDGTYDLADEDQKIERFGETGLGYFDTRLTEEERIEGGHPEDEIMLVEGVSLLRQHIRNEISDNGHLRPQHNVERNA